jgi:hypothetical protein
METTKMLDYTLLVLSAVLAALRTLPPIDWIIVAYELLTTTGLVLSAAVLTKIGVEWVWRRWFNRGRAS